LRDGRRVAGLFFDRRRLRIAAARLDCGVEIFESIRCPFCGQRFEVVVDTSVASQRFTTDCEVCCRPFEVVVECEPGEILSLDVLEN
jgi:transcription elongation factor Elf1